MSRTLAPSVLLAACVASHPAQGPSQQPASAWRADCRALRTHFDSLPLAAQRCGELFVRVNGYTETPATTDTTEIVLEPDWVVLAPNGQRLPANWLAILARRRGLLRPKAVTATCSRHDCFVIFEYAAPAYACRFRALVLSTDLRDVGFAHQDILPRSDELPSRCREAGQG